jgi:hypothetical protein
MPKAGWKMPKSSKRANALGAKLDLKRWKQNRNLNNKPS